MKLAITSPTLLRLLVLLALPPAFPSAAAQEDDQSSPYLLTTLSTTSLSLLVDNITDYSVGSELIFPPTFTFVSGVGVEDYFLDEAYSLVSFALLAPMAELAALLQIPAEEMEIRDTFVKEEDETELISFWGLEDVSWMWPAAAAFPTHDGSNDGGKGRWNEWLDDVTKLVSATSFWNRRWDDSSSGLFPIGPPVGEWGATMALRLANVLLGSFQDEEQEETSLWGLAGAQAWIFLRAVRMVLLKEVVSVGVLYYMLPTTEEEDGRKRLEMVREEVRRDAVEVRETLGQYFEGKLATKEYMEKVFRVGFEEHGCLGRYYVEMREEGRVDGEWVGVGQEGEGCWNEDNCPRGGSDEGEDDYSCAKAEDVAVADMESLVQQFWWEDGNYKRFLGSEYLSILEELDRLARMDDEDMVFDEAISRIIAEEGWQV